jgi:hypothetical protein
VSKGNNTYAFDRDLKVGLGAEEWFVTMTGGSKVEIKYDRRATETGNVYVEVEHNPGRKGWKPSGLTISEADAYTFAFGNDGNGVPTSAITVSTARLKYLVGNSPNAKKVSMDYGSCPTKGIALPITTLLVGE